MQDSHTQSVVAEPKGGDASVFPTEHWLSLAELARKYSENSPFPHICLDGFLTDQAARAAAVQFPTADSQGWIQYKHYNERTLGLSRWEMFPAGIAEITAELNSPGFVEWLAALTGIPDLRADPDLAGGGMHQTEAGGFLKIHADFQAHPYRRGWQRRCNLILYLNEVWDDAWGGQLEFWDGTMKSPEIQISPVFNRAVIFNTTPTSLHGYPEPIQCPPHLTRKSLAIYYYTVGAEQKAMPTRYFSRPEDGPAARLGTTLDNLLLWMYDRAKRTFRLSDRFASWLLDLLSRR